MAHRRRVVAHFIHLSEDPGHGAVHGQHHGAHALHGFDHRRELRDHLRHEPIQVFDVTDESAKFLVDLIDAVYRVEYRSDGPADRNIKAVLFPVEIATDRPPEVIEIRDFIPQLIGDLLHLFGIADHLVRNADELLHDAIHPLHQGDRLGHFVGLFQHVVHPVALIFHLLHLTGALHAELERYGRVVHRRTVGPGYRLDAGDPRDPEETLGQPVQDQKVRRIPHVMTRLDHENLGLHPGLAEMAIRGRKTLIGRDEGGQIGPIVVAGLVSGQGDQAYQSDGARDGENGQRPAHHHGADPSPATYFEVPLGVEDSEPTAHDENCRAQRQRDRDRDHQAYRAGNAQGLKVGHPRETEAERRSGDRQTGPENDVGGAFKHGVEGRFLVLAGLAGLLVAANDENPIVGTGGDSQRREQADREGGKPHQPALPD